MNILCHQSQFKHFDTPSSAAVSISEYKRTYQCESNRYFGLKIRPTAITKIQCNDIPIIVKSMQHTFHEGQLLLASTISTGFVAVIRVQIFILKFKMHVFDCIVCFNKLFYHFFSHISIRVTGLRSLLIRQTYILEVRVNWDSLSIWECIAPQQKCIHQKKDAYGWIKGVCVWIG